MSLFVAASSRVGSLEISIELEVAAGTVCAVVGPNGAGKTTLLRMVAGLHPIFEGKVSSGGVTFEEPATGRYLTPQDRAVGFVFQDLDLIRTMTALENIAFGLEARGMDRRRAASVARERLASMEMEHFADVKPEGLSRGQAQRVAVARTLVTEPKLLLLDEPFAALDAASKESLRLELSSLFETFGGPVLLVTHDPAEVAGLADQTVTMENGRLISGSIAPSAG